MTPKPESETDPWAAVRRYQRHVGGTFLSPVGGWCFWHEVDAARAAEAAQHQQEIARWRKAMAYVAGDIAATATPEECEQRGREIDAIDEDYEMACRTNQALSARLAAVEAERDKAQRALATAYLKARRQASVCEPNEDQFAGAMAVVAAAFPNTRVEATAIRIAKPEEPTELVVAVKRRAERAEAERDQLQNQIIDLGARVAIADEERAEAVAIRAERDRLLSEVEQAVTAFKCGVCGVVHLPSTYNEGTKTGWAECFYRGERDRLKAALQDAVYTIAGWRTGSIGSIGNVHVGSFDVEHLARLRAALTPQGQSTDGETR